MMLEHKLKENAGHNLRLLRGSRTQDQFADYLGITRGSLSNYELGNSTIPISIAITICKSNGIELEKFFIEKLESQ